MTSGSILSRTNHLDAAADADSRANGAAGALPIVGRTREWVVLNERFESAIGGNGGVEVLFLAGEPGIGKTRLTRAFVSSVRSRGALSLLGRCYEGDWAPPFGPWAEALGDPLAGLPPARLAALLGEAAPLLLRLMRELAARLTEQPPLAITGDQEERFRLFDAVADLLGGLASGRPLVLVLDDLHWADADTIALIRHLVRRRDLRGIFMIGAYRDVGLDRSHPLNDLLALLPSETGRASGSLRLRLRGLARADATALVERTAQRPLSPELVRTLLRGAGGNPFYLQELIRHLVEDGRLVEQPESGRWSVAGDPHDQGIPDGVRQVVEGRIARLSAATGQLLSRAAVFAGAFDFRVVRSLTGLEENVLLDAMDQAIETGLIRSVDGRAERYEFVHAIVRQTLADGWSPSRRIRLHRQAAGALRAAYPDREEEFAAELATQFHASAALAGAEAGIPFALIAADRAGAAFAWDQEVAFLRIARDLAESADQSGRADLLVRLAIAEADAMMLDDAIRTVDHALTALADRDTDAAEIASFIAAVSRALVNGGASENVVRPLAERGLGLIGDRRDLTWARLTTLYGPREPLRRGYIKADRWVGHDATALAIIRQDGEPIDYARSLEPLEPATRTDTDALLALTETWDNLSAVRRALRTILRRYLYQHGAFREAEAVATRLLRLSERDGSIPSMTDALTYLTRLHSARGDFDLARETREQVIPLLARFGPAHRLNDAPYWIELYLALFLDGDWPSIAAYWTRLAIHPLGYEGLFGPHWAAIAAQAHARAGAEVETRRILAELVPLLETVGLTYYGHSAAVAMAAGAAWDLALTDGAGRLRALAERQIAEGLGDVPSTSRHLTVARMAALQGDLDAAAAAFAAARDVLAADGQRPLRAMVDYDEALARRRAGARQSSVGPLAEAARAAFANLRMSHWEARAAALAGGAASASPIATTGLTVRELDVLRLIARGMSDRQIGDALGLSGRTVGTHVRHMLAKTNLDNRTELSVWAVERGLVSSGAA